MMSTEAENPAEDVRRDRGEVAGPRETRIHTCHHGGEDQIWTTTNHGIRENDVNCHSWRLTYEVHIFSHGEHEATKESKGADDDTRGCEGLHRPAPNTKDVVTEVSERIGEKGALVHRVGANEGMV